MRVLFYMNYQLLIESYSFGTTLSNQEIELLSLELETQIINMTRSFYDWLRFGIHESII